MNEQAVQIDEAVADVERIGTVLSVVPEFVDAEYQTIKSRDATVVGRTGCEVSYGVHFSSGHSVIDG
jgi:hypothetical protein